MTGPQIVIYIPVETRAVAYVEAATLEDEARPGLDVERRDLHAEVAAALELLLDALADRREQLWEQE